jgi:acyl dehydratase
MRYFEDFVVGEIIECGGRVVTKAEILAFARDFDPQPFHVDEAAAAKGRYGGIIGSGLHSCALAMRMAVDRCLNDSSNTGSPGIDRIRFLKPLRPEEQVTVKLRIADKAPSTSKPDRGRIDLVFELYDAGDDLIMDMQAKAIFLRRAAS